MSIDKYIAVDAGQKELFSSQFNTAKGEQGAIITNTSEPLGGKVFVAMNANTDLSDGQKQVVAQFTTASFEGHEDFYAALKAARAQDAIDNPRTKVPESFIQVGSFNCD